MLKSIALALGAVAGSHAIQCIDPQGNAVDWWVIYKLPGGETHTYFDTHTAATTFKIQGDEFTGALKHTMDGVYKGSKSSLGWVMWNDDPPVGTGSSSKAHSKGVLAVDKDEGFWLLHSTPRFPAPQADGPFDFPSNELIYGQTYLCLTYDVKSIDVVAAGLQLSHVNVYDSNLPKGISTSDLQGLVDGTIDKTEDTRINDLATVGGAKWTLFFKAARWADDLWDHLVAPRIKQDMWVETWMRPKQDSDCSDTYKVQNVQSLFIGGVNFTETQDHSKWGVAQKGNWVCIGGINRMTSQRKRGGGAACIQHAKLATCFRNTIAEYDEC